MTSDEDHRESVVRVNSDFVEATSSTRYMGGTNDWKVTRTSIKKVVDRFGEEHEPVWEENGTEIFPGATTVREDWTHVLRVSREAFPVRVQFSRVYEYWSYDYWEHNSVTHTHYWVRYEAGEGPDTTSKADPHRSDD
jgi:hypothetical protein